MIGIALKRTGTMLAIALMAGCKMNLTADVYSSDLWEVAAGATGLTAPVTMAFEVPGVEDCDEHAAEISAIMAGVMRNFSPRGCEMIELESFLMADTHAPVTNSLEAWREADSLLGLVVSEPEDGAMNVFVLLDKDKYTILDSRMEEKFFQKVDLAQSSVRLILNNDDRGGLRFTVKDAFVNSEPFQVEETLELKRRHKAEIRFSNVATAALARHGVAFAFVLKKGP